MLNLLYIPFLITLLTISHLTTGQDWNYDKGGDDWPRHFPSCSGTMQSPIDIDLYTIDTNCPITNTVEPTIQWNLDQFGNDSYRLWNNGKQIKFYPVFDYNDFGLSQGYLKLTKSDNTIARLRNNFVTTSGEHKVYCMDSVHFHLTLTNDQGSEHKISGVSYPLAAHFVHYSCDYKDIGEALAAEPEDPYVLAVVTVKYEIGPDNRFIERMITFNDYILTESEEEDATVQYEFNILDLIPNKMADFYYYEGGLTTPPCTEKVRWHILTERVSVSERQLKFMRNYRDNEGNLLAPNVRNAQFNENPVYLCSGKDFERQNNVDPEPTTTKDRGYGYKKNKKTWWDTSTTTSTPETTTTTKAKKKYGEYRKGRKWSDDY